MPNLWQIGPKPKRAKNHSAWRHSQVAVWLEVMWRLAGPATGPSFGPGTGCMRWQCFAALGPVTHILTETYIQVLSKPRQAVSTGPGSNLLALNRTGCFLCKANRFPVVIDLFSNNCVNLAVVKHMLNMPKLTTGTQRPSLTCIPPIFCSCYQFLSNYIFLVPPSVKTCMSVNLWNGNTDLLLNLLI